MKTKEQLRDLLRSIDHKGYPQYKSLRGEYRFSDYILSIDHVRYCLLHRMKADELKQLMDSAPEDGTGRVRTVRTSPFRNEKYEREHFSGKVPEKYFRERFYG